MQEREPDFQKTNRAKAAFGSPNTVVSSDGTPISELEHYLHDWIMDGKMRQQFPRTIEVRHYLTKNLLWFLNREAYSVCGTSQLRAFLVHVSDGHQEPGGRWGNPRMTKPVRPATVRSYYRELCVFFNWLVKDGALPASPMERISPPKVRAEQVQPFTSDQVEALIAAAKQSPYPRRDEAIVRFLHDTGIRASELCSLKRNHLDLQERRCTVIGKGNKRRTIHFGRSAGKALWQYLREHPCSDDDPLFVSDRGLRAGDPLTRSGLLQLIERLGKKANLQAVRCSPHTFRHTFAVDFLRHGGNVFSLKEMMGHTGLHMTNKYVSLAQADIANQHQQFSPGDRLKGNRT